MSRPAEIEALIEAELAEPVDARVSEVAAAIAARYPQAARSVLFYGSCLRQRELGGLMLDFYLIVSGYRAAYGRGWRALANALIPPNVFAFEHRGLVAKYAVLSETDLARECSQRARSPSVWARFAQPSRLVWTADPAARTAVVRAVAQAAPTLFAFTRPILPESLRDDAIAVFREGFALTYGAELRAERRERPDAIVEADPARYRRLGDAVLTRAGNVALGARRARRRWRWRQRKGKAMTLVRLMKASTTFAGGIDYLAWKINRHAGTDIRLKPWQRRWPLIAALTLLPRLLRRGAIR